MTTTDQAPEAEPIDTPTIEPTALPKPDEPGVQVEKLEHIDALDILPDQGEWERLCIMARTLALATSAPDAVRNKPADMLLVLLTGRDLGIKLTEAVRTVQVVEGKISLAPRLKIALIESKGLGWIKPCVVDPRVGACPVCGDPIGNTTEKATAHAWRAADDTMASYVFTMEDAKRAKIIKDRGAWTTYPQRMLWWRASGYLADDLFPNAAIGIYSPDELGGMTDEDGAYIDVSVMEPAEGFGRPKATVEQASDEQRADFIARIDALPTRARAGLAPLWKEKLPAVASLTVPQVRTAEALIASFEKRAANGEWGDWTPPAPADEGAAANEKPADAPLSAPEPAEAPTLLDATQEPQGEAQGQAEPTDEAVAAAIAHVQGIADKRQVVLELGAHGLATTGNEQSMRKRLALFYAEHPDQLPKGEG